jgi:CRP/FNR family transcriptional regulator, anaerobic regulatory protein
MLDNAISGLDSGRSGEVSPPGLGMLEQGFGNGLTKVFEPKQHVFCVGDVVSNVYRIESGLVCVYRLLSDGRRQIIDFGLPGDVIGFGEIGQHAANAQARGRTRARCLPVSWVQDAVRENAGTGADLFQAVAAKLADVQDRLLTLGRRNSVERLAIFLLMLSRRNARRGQDRLLIDLPMTRADIADYLGLTMETVSRTFSYFKTHGLIRLLPGGRIKLLDPSRLGELAQNDASN